MGIFAYAGIMAGEIVWAEPKEGGPTIAAIPRSRAWIEALPPASRRAYCHFMYKTGDDECAYLCPRARTRARAERRRRANARTRVCRFQSLAEFNDVPIEDFPSVLTIDVSNYMNHSCEPTCWFVQGGPEYTGLMVAARDIMPGEEITFDYCTSEDCELSPSWECECGAATCRKRITPLDWQLPELQQRYESHFLDHIAAKIASKTGAPPAPLQTVEPARSWWIAMRASPARDEPILRDAARGADLEVLNRQMALLIAEHGLTVVPYDDPALGHYVRAGADVPVGELVMLLPPNKLLLEPEVGDFNECLQLCVAPGGRLFSSSLTRHDVDNYLCHSCDPNCEVIVGVDLAAGLRAIKPIRAGDAVCFDYDTTEDDLRGDRGGFDCQCGADNCRGQARASAPRRERATSATPPSPPPPGPPDWPSRTQPKSPRSRRGSSAGRLSCHLRLPPLATSLARPTPGPSTRPVQVLGRLYSPKLCPAVES